MQSGGAKPMMFPSGIARAITPRRVMASEIFGPTVIGSNHFRAFGSSMNSTAAMRPTPRTSPTFRCPPTAVLSASSRYGPVSAAFFTSPMLSMRFSVATPAAALTGWAE